MKSKQRGITLIGFVIMLGIAGLFIYVGMKLVPMYTEFYSLKKALASLGNEPGIGNQSQAKVSELLFKRLYISYSENIKKQHVKIVREGNGWKITVDYENRRELIANLDVVGKFHAEKLLGNTAGGE